MSATKPDARQFLSLMRKMIAEAPPQDEMVFSIPPRESARPESLPIRDALGIDLPGAQPRHITADEYNAAYVKVYGADALPKDLR